MINQHIGSTTAKNAMQKQASQDSEKSTSHGSESSKQLSRASSTTSETPKYEEEIVLADDQRAELREAFGLFEKAGKGRINVRDLGALLRSLGMNPSERDLEEARHELEISGTFSRARGTVSFADVERYIARRGGVFLGCDEEEDIHAAFQVLDRNGNGRIDIDEFRHFMTTMGERMTPEEVEELLSVAKKDGEAFIEYKDIVRALQSANT
ncbi:calmodulin-A-like isoform X2 [Haliotis rubra]|uniref:calmodulin-A-like isoform X2 n=1 Tax=Haliotis rubra TaxID=36100 RepID=UPI001EE5E1AE|nr:calmodulin-A-like isoform X2 [Haliotis rubra]